jgi:NarL family two-component system response regulator LiaR
MIEKKTIRVLLADDHGMVRKGIIAYLKNQAGVEICGEARNGREAIALCEEHQVDVVLMDLVMPELNGVAATREIREKWPDIQVIALTSFQEKDLIKDVLQAGAISYLLKDVTGEELAEAIRAAHSGRPMLASEALEALIQPDKQTSDLGKDLTRREFQVLELLVKGLSNPEIAQKLFISRSTVKVHVSNILSKLGVINRAEAIVLAIENKIVS